MSSPDAEEVQVFLADYALKEKLGNQSFDQIVTPKIITDAEQEIAQLSGEILSGVQRELTKLQKAVGMLTVGALPSLMLRPVIDSAFAIKSSAGFCGYSLASSLAKSLHLYCELENVQLEPLSAKSLAVIRTQVEGLKTILTNKLTGDGGVVGAAILGELQKLLGNS